MILKSKIFNLPTVQQGLGYMLYNTACVHFALEPNERLISVKADNSQSEGPFKHRGNDFILLHRLTLLQLTPGHLKTLSSGSKKLTGSEFLGS